MQKDEVEKEEIDNEETFQEEGAAYMDWWSIVGMIIAIGISTLVLIFVGTLGGSTYTLVQADITAITNATIKGYVEDAIGGGFKGLKTAGDYMPLIVLAVVITIVLSLIVGMGFGAGTAYAQGGGYYGGAL